MINTKEVDFNLLEADFYDKPFKFSYSSLNKILTAPSIFYKEYILKEREDEFKKYLLEGILIHFLVLENENFDEKFLVMPDTLPSPTSITVADAIFKIYLKDNDPDKELGDYPTEILDQLIELNKHQSLKDTKDGTGDSKRIAKIVELKTEVYFDFLKRKKGRTIIDSGILDKCTRRAEIVKANPKMRELLGLDLDSDGITFGVYNELMLEVEKVEGVPFGYKGIVDNIVVDVKNKLISINDFKTTSKSLTEFTNSIEYWNYWLQAAMYDKLVRAFFVKLNLSEWTVQFNFVVFDAYDQLYAFPVTPATMEEWKNRLKNVEKEALYHYNSKDFTLPYKYAIGNVKL
jgi:hypothetical protein